MINIGVIGCGKIAMVRHLPEISKLKNAKITALFDLNKERAEELSKEYGGKVYDQWQDLIKASDVDAVFVLTANSFHAEISIAALEAGKHVMCEKPMAVTEDECEKMVEAAKKSGKYLMIGQNQRLAEAHIKAHQLIKSGKIGKILTFQTTFGHAGADNWSVDGKKSWFFDKSKAHFGAIVDLGVHKTDLIQYLLDDYIIEVSAYLATLDKKDEDGNPIELEDNAICLYKMHQGSIGTMTASWTTYGREENSTILYGTEGTMEIYKNPEHSIVVYNKDGSVEYYDTENIQTNNAQTDSGIAELFINSIISCQEPEISGESVLKAMRAVFGAEKSFKTGMSVRVNVD